MADELTVRHAAYRGMRESGGQTLAEVEVHMADAGEPELLAYFRNGPKGYQLVRVLANDAATEVDWYDNNMHQAFEDLTQRMFSGPSHLAVNDRNEFAGQVLAVSGVMADLDRHFQTGGGESIG